MKASRSSTTFTNKEDSVDAVGRPFPGNGRVSGVVEDVRLTRGEDLDRAEVYAPFGGSHFERLRSVSVLVRAKTKSDTARLVYSLPRSLRHLDTQAPSISVLQNDLNGRLAEQELLSAILSSLAVLALAVACMGIFGVVSYGVTVRRKEIGIRIALGALSHSIIVLMIQRLIVPVSLALVAGLIGGIAVGLVFASEGEAFDPPEAPVAAAAVLVLLLAIGVACVLPTPRALRSADSRVLSS